MSWIPNKNMTDCVKLVTNNKLYSTKEDCLRNCTFNSNYTLINNCKNEMLNEKFCTKEDCVNICKEVKNKDSCLYFCNEEKFMKKNDYDYLYCCGSNIQDCKKKCKEAISCRFNSTPIKSCNINICKNSCQYDKNKKCNDNNDYCWMYDVKTKDWIYNFSDSLYHPNKCGKIDNDLYLKSIENGKVNCINNTNKCMWDCSIPSHPKKVLIAGLDPKKYKCYEKKSNCCQNDPNCL
jgi:hemerythrin